MAGNFVEIEARRHFGGRNVSGVIGVLYTSVAFGTLICPSVSGFVFDLSHSDELPIIAGAVPARSALQIELQ